MKEATGELNMTVVTLVAISAVGALLYLVIWPMVQRVLVDNTCKTYGDTWHAVKVNGDVQIGGSGDAEVIKYGCCQEDESGNVPASFIPNSSQCFAP